MNRLAPSPIRTRVLPLLLLFGGVLAQGCKESTAATPPPAAPPVDVAAASVTEVEAPQTLRLTGTLRGEQQTDLAANVAGRVIATRVEQGSEIKQGDVVAQVDTRAAALSLQAAKIEVETSKTRQAIDRIECERYTRLHEKGAVTGIEYDQVMAKCKTAPLNLEAAEARRALAAKNVGDGRIRAPFSGVVVQRYVEVGEYVQASSPIVSIADIDTLRLAFSVPEAHFGDVHKDAEVTFRVAAHGEDEFHGKVAFVAGAVRESTRDLMVEAIVDNRGRRLVPGMFADVSLRVGTRKLPSVPKSAVFQQNDKPNVFVISGGILEQRVIQPADEFQGRIPILRGVRPGEAVVGQYDPKLSNGQRVQ